LLTDPKLRGEFDRDPTGVAERLGAAELASLNPDELREQARVLIGKRRNEVRKLLPRTFAQPGMNARFDAYASTRWPRGHRRHLEDALGFCEFLSGDGCRAERHRIEFALSSRRIDARMAPDLQVDGKSRRALQFFIRWGGRPREFALYLRFD
jgi:hypothetical protein